MLAELAGRQHGVVSLAQLEALGFARSSVTKRVGSGRLHRVRRGVYAVGHSGLSREGFWMAAVLGAGPGAVLSHLSAAVLWGFWRRPVRGIDVSALGRRRVVGVRVRTCRALDARDLAVRDGIPVTSVARTLVDLGDVLDRARLANAIHEAAFLGRFDEAAVRAAMARARGRRLGVVEAALRDHAGGSAGTRSALEDRFLAMVRRAGLPEPRVNVRVAGLEVDFHWPGLGLCVEVDGPGHARPRTRAEDRRREAVLRAAGQDVLRAREGDLADVVARVRSRVAG